MIRRWRLLGLIVLAMGIAGQATGVSVVQASCGDYLDGPHSSLAKPLALGDQDEVRWPVDSPMPRRTPCQGPECRKAPSVPVSPAPVKFTGNDHERLGCMNAELPLPVSDRLLWGADSLAVVAAGVLLSIEHPPRA